MQQRRIGRDGPLVGAIGMGCMAMAGWYGTRDDDAAIAAVHRAVDLGISLFDTSDLYGGGDNERLVGRALAGRRDRVVLSTKFGNTWDDRGWPNGVNGRPDYCRSACDASLKRLGVDVIDLYYLHRVDPEVPVEDTIGAMAGLVAAGKVRHIGVSEVNPNTLRRAHAVHPISALQTEYSLWSREPETELFALCDQLGIGFVGYAPLGRGLLAGQIKSPDDLPEGDIRRVLPRFQADALKRNEKLVARIRELAAAKRCTPAQLALAWILVRQPNVVPLQGADRAPLVEENAGAVDVALSSAEVADLDAANPPEAVTGGRYPEAWMEEINR
jgi:aryl-alcohol dehydrogenase-like predicted oxidoreductase